MRILIAPDKFKGTLTQREATSAMHRGVERGARELNVEIEVDECPVADGGEGTLDVLAVLATNSGREMPRDSIASISSSCRIRLAIAPPGVDMREKPPGLHAIGLILSALAILAMFMLVADSSTKWRTVLSPVALVLLGLSLPPLPVLWIISHLRSRASAQPPFSASLIESARILGFRTAAARETSPEARSTRDLRRAIMECAGRDVRLILVALGGTATIDGGIGMADDFGCLLFDKKWKRLEGSSRNLCEVDAIALLDASSVLRSARLLALCDVQNPLLGPRGAARMFGPQKGATPEQVERLEAGLENLVRVCRQCNIPCDPDQPGAGAAGGLGFGLATFLGAKLVPGAPYILDLLNFDERCARADLVITGEGKMDMQTAEGKACAEVARRAERAGKPCIAVVGTTEGEPEALRAALARSGILFSGIHRVTDHSLEQSVGGKGSAADLEEATCRSVLDHLRK